MDKKNTVSSWIWGSIVGTSVILGGYLFTATTSSSYNNGNTRSGVIAGWILLISIGVLVYSLIASFKLRGWLKVIPIFCGVVCFGVGVLSYIAYTMLLR